MQVAARTKESTETKMDIREIKRLVELMVHNDLSELDISEGENKIHLKRGGAVVSAAPAVAPASPVAAPAASAAPAAAPADDKLVEIRSPMVGTFYAAPSPDSEPFVRVGAAVSDDNVVCIVEAMKVMNEIKAEHSGTIVEVCVKNAQPVEYGQVLFKVKT
jgi:acetyl-CoA carboxylase biotin carboxyl carrier protein